MGQFPHHGLFGHQFAKLGLIDALARSHVQIARHAHQISVETVSVFTLICLGRRKRVSNHRSDPVGEEALQSNTQRQRRKHGHQYRRHEGHRRENPGKPKVQHRPRRAPPALDDQKSHPPQDHGRQCQDVAKVDQQHDAQQHRRRTRLRPVAQQQRRRNGKHGPQQHQHQHPTAEKPLGPAAPVLVPVNGRHQCIAVCHVTSCPGLFGGPQTVANLHQFVATCDRNVKLPDFLAQGISIDAQKVGSLKLIAPCG